MIKLAQRDTSFSTGMSNKKRKKNTTKLSSCLMAGLALVASLASSYSHAEANTALGGSKASAHLNFRIVIPAIVRVKALTQASGVTITQNDVDRGHLDLDAASTLMLTSNSRNGYIVSANFDSGILESIEVKLPNKTLHAGASSGTKTMHVNAPILVDEVVGVSYRLYLKPGLKAGHYHWPVALAFMPNSGCATC
jgi:hypothetical protein